jgi:hypothetical protein
VRNAVIFTVDVKTMQVGITSCAGKRGGSTSARKQKRNCWPRPRRSDTHGARRSRRCTRLQRDGWLRTFTSYYTVEAESEGVVLRFGKFLETVEPGLHFKMPFGIDVVTVLPIRRQLKLELGFATPGYTANPIQAGQDPRGSNG